MAGIAAVPQWPQGPQRPHSGRNGPPTPQVPNSASLLHSPALRLGASHRVHCRPGAPVPCSATATLGTARLWRHPRPGAAGRARWRRAWSRLQVRVVGCAMVVCVHGGFRGWGSFSVDRLLPCMGQWRAAWACLQLQRVASGRGLEQRGEIGARDQIKSMPRGRKLQASCLPSAPRSAATYPAWEPDTAGQQVLAQVAAAAPAAAASSSLAWSMLPLPHHQQQRRQAPPSPRHQKLAAALAAGRGRPNGAPAGSGIFGSADFTAQEQLGPRAAASAAAAAAGGPADNLPASLAADLAPLDGLAASQLMLQSLYEQREQQPQQPQHAGPVLVPVPPAVAAAGAAAAGPLHQPQPQQPRHAEPRHQRGFAAVQGPLPIPQQALGSSQPASASPLHALLASPASQAAPSPRQPWPGR